MHDVRQLMHFTAKRAAQRPPRNSELEVILGDWAEPPVCGHAFTVETPSQQLKKRAHLPAARSLACLQTQGALTRRRTNAKTLQTVGELRHGATPSDDGIQSH